MQLRESHAKCVRLACLHVKVMLSQSSSHSPHTQLHVHVHCHPHTPSDRVEPQWPHPQYCTATSNTKGWSNKYQQKVCTCITSTCKSVSFMQKNNYVNSQEPNNPLNITTSQIQVIQRLSFHNSIHVLYRTAPTNTTTLWILRLVHNYDAGAASVTSVMSITEKSLFYQTNCILAVKFFDNLIGWTLVNARNATLE